MAIDTLASLKSPIRDVSTWTFACYADPDLFLEWENVPGALKDEVEMNGAVPCEGSGGVGPWCMDCRFGHGEET